MLKTILFMLALFIAALLMSGFSGDTSIGLQSLKNPTVTGSRLPRLRTLPSGDVLMSWIEPQSDGHSLKFAVFHDGHWVRSGEVANGNNWFINWSDFPSVVAIDEKFWLAHWLVKQTGGKAHDYDVATSISNDAGLTWAEPKHPHRDGVAAEHGFAAIFPVNGDAGIVWLDGRDYLKKAERVKNLGGDSKKSGNFNLRYTRIHRDGSMEAEQVIDNNTCTCCWPSVAVTYSGPIVVWRGRTEAEVRDNRVSVMLDGRWSAPAALGAEGWLIEGCPVNGPAVAARGMQVVSAWFSAEGDRPRVRVAFSRDGGINFGTPIEIDDTAPLGRIGLVWKDDSTAVISWMTATDAVTKKSSLAIRTIHVDGSLGWINRVLEISAGRDTGVPQMVTSGAGLALAWTDAAPSYGVRTALLSWDDLQSHAFFNPASFSKATLFGHNALPFTPIICGQPH
ncbi:hypothetical protein MCEKH45_00192 [Methylophilaceae bacterium]